jgi:hypothetical protein
MSTEPAISDPSALLALSPPIRRTRSRSSSVPRATPCNTRLRRSATCAARFGSSPERLRQPAPCTATRFCHGGTDPAWQGSRAPQACRRCGSHGKERLASPHGSIKSSAECTFPGWGGPDRYGSAEKQRREAWPISRAQAVMGSRGGGAADRPQPTAPTLLQPCALAGPRRRLAEVALLLGSWRSEGQSRRQHVGSATDKCKRAGHRHHRIGGTRSNSSDRRHEV